MSYFYFSFRLTWVIISSASFKTYLLQIHLIRIVPGFKKLASALLLQRYYHNVISPRKKRIFVNIWYSRPCQRSMHFSKDKSSPLGEYNGHCFLDNENILWRQEQIQNCLVPTMLTCTERVVCFWETDKIKSIKKQLAGNDILYHLIRTMFHFVFYYIKA